MSNPNIQYRPDIDGLRAIAVLAVVTFHAFPDALPGGFVGVDFFFVISGYLIGGILLKSIANNTFSFADFYARRVNRIFPALLTVLVSCYVFGWFGLFADEFEQLGKHLAGGAAFVSNIVLLNESGYFDNSAETKPLLHLWSLGVEEQFYFLWPIILWAAWKLRVNILAISAVLFAISFTLNISMLKGDPVTIFYSPHTRFWEIIAGAILAYFTIFKNLQPRFYAANILSMIGVALVAYGILTISKENAFPGWFALIPVAAAVLLIAAGPGAIINKYVLASRPMVWVGLISFPLYLWHWPLLSFNRIVEGGTPTVEFRLVAVVAAFILAAATFYLIEKPLRAKSEWRFKTGSLSSAMMAVFCIGAGTAILKGIPERPSIGLYTAVNQQFSGWNYATNEQCLTSYNYEESKTYKWWFCITDAKPKPSVLLLGNSYANHLFPGLTMAPEFKEQGFLSIGTCDPTQANTQAPLEPGDTKPCSGYRALHQWEMIKGIVKSNATIKHVIISGLPQSPSDEAITALEKTIGFFKDHGIQVIVFKPHFLAGFDPRSCFSRPFSSIKPRECVKPAGTEKSLERQFSGLVQRVSEDFPEVLFYDQNRANCDQNGCHIVVNGMPLYRDQDSHYTVFGSVRTAQDFVSWAKMNAPDMVTSTN